MISLKTIHRSSAKDASRYYADQKDDYYNRDGSASQWQGRAAADLGLTGDVQLEQLQRALRSDFGADVKLSRSIRLDSKARAAVDITFSAPKSVSIQALVGKDVAAIQVHDQAVTKALDFLEAELVRARQTERGVTTMERSGNAAIAKFRHETARPVAGAYSDPQLHTHALVLNITRRADGSWTAMSNDEIYRLSALVNSVYLAELAAGLEKAGHQLRYQDKSFELAHISRPQIEGFSKRSQEINAELAEIGKTRMTASPKLKQMITLTTRRGKTPEISREEQQRDWERQAEDLGIAFDAEKRPRQKMKERSPEAAALVADRCLQWAIKHHTERESVMDGNQMLETALFHSQGTGIGLADLKAAVKRSLNKGHLILGTLHYRPARDRSAAGHSRASWVEQLVAEGMSKKRAEDKVRDMVARGELVSTGARYTTQVAREREKRILQIEREGRNQVAPILQAEAAQAAMEGRGLKPGQLASAELILSTAHRFIGVQGKAGTGKSHMLTQVKEAAAAAGYTVKAVASYGKQIEALRELGMEARTVASVLEARQRDRFKLDAKTVLVIDEAGVVPARIMERLMKMAEADGARIVMLGDTGQTKAIEAGRPFDQLQAAGMATALMSDIIRQKSPVLKAAVELAGQGQASASLDVISSKLEAVHTIDSNWLRYQTIANRYATLSADERRETLIITGTNASRNALNEAAHEALGLVNRGFEFTLLTRRDTTQAERRIAKYYVAGDIIQPERDYKQGNLRQGELYRVIGSVQGKPNELEVEHIGTKFRGAFNPSRVTKISVYEPVQAELSAGDWVRVTRNDAKLDLVNGGRFEVLSVTPTTVTIGDGTRRLTLDASAAPLHLDRAYASTSHSAQGLTCDRVLYNAESFTRTTQRDVYYVGISRARHQVEIFTESERKLVEKVDREEVKKAALDIGLDTARSWRPKHVSAGHQMGS